MNIVMMSKILLILLDTGVYSNNPPNMHGGKQLFVLFASIFTSLVVNNNFY